MAVPQIDQLVLDVRAEHEVVDGAIVLIEGFNKRLQDGIDAALKGGATAAELTVLTALSADVQAKKALLAKAVFENTPPPAPVP